MLAKIRPQILVALMLLGALAGFGIFTGYTEVSAACIGGMTALSMKLLEGE